MQLLSPGSRKLFPTIKSIADNDPVVNGGVHDAADGDMDDARAAHCDDALQPALRVVLPPPDYARARYGIASGKPLAPWYLHRWKRQAGEIRDWMRNRRVRP